MAIARKPHTAKKRLTETQLALLKMVCARPLTIKDIQLASRVPKPTFAAFARTAKKLGLVQTGEIRGYFYYATQKGRKVVFLSERVDEALGDGNSRPE